MTSPWRRVVVVLAAAGAIGCSGSSSTNGGIDGSVAGGPVTIEFLEHGNPDYTKANGVAFRAYEAGHAGVTVHTTTLDYPTVTATLLADLKNDRLKFDLVQVPGNWVCSFAANLADVPADILTPDAAKTTFFDPQVEGVSCQSALKGLPIEYNLEYGGVVLNVDKYQAKFPGKMPAWPDWTTFIGEASMLAEFDADVPKANGLDLDPNWPGPIVYIFLASVLQHGGDYWAATPTHDTFDLSTPAARAALDDITGWILKNKVMSMNLIPPDPGNFVATRLAVGSTGYGWSDPAKPLSVMGFIGSWGLASVKNYLPAERKNVNYGYFAIPPMAGTAHSFVTYGGWSFAVPKSSKNQRLAWEIAKSLALDPAAMRQWSATTLALPALRVNATPEMAAADPVLKQVQPLLEQGRYIGHMPAAAIQTMEGAISSNVFAVVKGMKSPEQALADMQKTTNDAFALYK